MTCVLIDKIPYVGSYLCSVYGWAGIFPAMMELIFMVAMAFVIWLVVRNFFS